MARDAAPDRRPEPEPATAEQYRQRAILLADLGRYDEALGELASGTALAPTDPQLLTTLARVHLAAGAPGDALAAADAATAAAPGAVEPRVARGLALIDLRRFAEAAQLAGELLRAGADDPAVLRSTAGLLAEARNGQPALDAAWRAVQLAPDDARGHLVLGVVAAHMRMFDLAERAYREALRLDPGLVDVHEDQGVVRLEQRRQAEALGRLAEAAVQPPPGDGTPPGAPAGPPPDSPPDAPVGDPPGAPAPTWPAPTGGDRAGDRVGKSARPRAPRDRSATADGVRQLVRYGAGFALGAAVVAALVAALDGGASRVLAGLFGVTGLLVLIGYAARVCGGVRQIAPVLTGHGRWVALAGFATLVTPALIVLYALLGGPWPLVLAIGLSAAAELILINRDHHG